MKHIFTFVAFALSALACRAAYDPATNPVPLMLTNSVPHKPDISTVTARQGWQSKLGFVPSPANTPSPGNLLISLDTSGTNTAWGSSTNANSTVVAVTLLDPLYTDGENPITNTATLGIRTATATNSGVVSTNKFSDWESKQASLGTNATNTALHGDLTFRPYYYSNLYGIPSTYPPTAHTQAMSTITGLETALTNKQTNLNLTSTDVSHYNTAYEFSQYSPAATNASRFTNYNASIEIASNAVPRGTGTKLIAGSMVDDGNYVYLSPTNGGLSIRSAHADGNITVFSSNYSNAITILVLTNYGYFKVTSNLSLNAVYGNMVLTAPLGHTISGPFIQHIGAAGQRRYYQYYDVANYPNLFSAMIQNGAGGLILGSYSGGVGWDSISFANDGGTRVTITSSGKVGIGVIPTKNFQVGNYLYGESDNTGEFAVVGGKTAVGGRNRLWLDASWLKVGSTFTNSAIELIDNTLTVYGTVQSAFIASNGVPGLTAIRNGSTVIGGIVTAMTNVPMSDVSGLLDKINTLSNALFWQTNFSLALSNSSYWHTNAIIANSNSAYWATNAILARSNAAVWTTNKVAVLSNSTSWLTNALASKANSTHTHSESDISGLVTDLASKEPSLGSAPAGTIVYSTGGANRSWIYPPTTFPGFGGNGTAASASHSDHNHGGVDAQFSVISSLYFSGPFSVVDINGVTQTVNRVTGWGYRNLVIDKGITKGY